jgi:hypothetical protein
MTAVELRESFVKIHSATKIRILFFYPFTVGYSQEEENRQSEKLHLVLDVSRKRAGLKAAPHCGESGGLGAVATVLFAVLYWLLKQLFAPD